MKKVPVQRDILKTIDCARLTRSDFDHIGEEVIASLDAARLRAAAGPERTSVARAAGPGADTPPLTNRGGKSEGGDFIGARLVLDDGKILEVPARRTWGGSAAFIDWINFTTDERDFIEGEFPVSDEDVVKLVSMRLVEVFGFGVTHKRESGANFYHRSYVLGDGFGMVCHGGQRGTVLRIEVEFKGIDRDIPFGILLAPGQFLAAAYPAFRWISTVQERILTIQKKLQASYKKKIEVAKHQCGKIVWFMAQMGESAEAIVAKLMREGVPSGIRLPMWQFAGEGVEHDKSAGWDRDVFDEMALA